MQPLWTRNSLQSCGSSSRENDRLNGTTTSTASQRSTPFLPRRPRGWQIPLPTQAEGTRWWTMLRSARSGKRCYWPRNALVGDRLEAFRASSMTSTLSASARAELLSAFLPRAGVRPDVWLLPSASAPSQPSRSVHASPASRDIPCTPQCRRRTSPQVGSGGPAAGVTLIRPLRARRHGSLSRVAVARPVHDLEVRGVEVRQEVIAGGSTTTNRTRAHRDRGSSGTGPASRRRGLKVRL